MIILRENWYSKYDNLEDYAELSDKDIKKLTETQKRLLLEDEREKAKRNTKRIVETESKKAAKEGREEGAKKGEKKGRRVGAHLGAATGTLIGLGATLGKGNSNKKIAGISAAAGLGGAGLGYLVGKSAGRSLGADHGEAVGRAKGAKEGLRIVKEEGHEATERTRNNARKLDDYARRHKQSDHYESDFRDQLRREEEAKKEAARLARQEELERRRVMAEETRARSAEMEARTNRSRYYDEYFGLGEANKKRPSQPSYVQNNYYNR